MWYVHATVRYAKHFYTAVLNISMESQDEVVSTIPRPQLEAIVARPNGRPVSFWGSGKNNPTSTGIVVGAQIPAFQESENIGTVSDGLPKGGTVGGHIKTWEFIYPYKDFSIIAYLRGDNLDELKNQNPEDPTAKFPDVIPKLRILLGRILPEEFMRHASDELVSFAIDSGDTGALDRYQVLIDTYRRWKKETGGFDNFNSNLFPEKIGQAFDKVRYAIESKEVMQALSSGKVEDAIQLVESGEFKRDLESLKTKESNRSYNFFADFLNEIFQLDAKTFLGNWEKLVEKFSRGLVEVASDGSDIFSYFQTKEDPEKVASEKTYELLEKISYEAPVRFLELITTMLNKQRVVLDEEVDKTSIYQLKDKKKELKEYFTNLVYNKLLEVSPLLILSNPQLKDKFGSQEFLEPLLDAQTSQAVHEKSLFGRVEAEIQESELAHYQKYFLDEFMGNYKSGIFEATAASDLFYLIPDTVRKVKGQQMSAKHKKEIGDLLKKLESQKPGQKLFTDHESAALTGNNLKTALISTVARIFRDAFSLSEGNILSESLSNAAEIEKTARNIYRISEMANAVGRFELYLFDLSRFIPTPEKMIESLEKKTEYTFTVKGDQYDLSNKLHLQKLFEFSSQYFTSKLISPLRTEKDEFYSKVLGELDEISEVVKSKLEPAEARNKLEEIMSRLSWDKTVESHDRAQSMDDKLKNEIYFTIRKGAHLFYTDLKKEITSLLGNEDERASRWDARYNSIKSRYEAIKKDIEKVFNKETNDFPSTLMGFVEGAKTKEEIGELGINASSVHSKVFYLLNEGGNQVKYDRDSMNSLEILYKLWTPERVLSVVKDSMIKTVDSRFFDKFREVISQYSNEGQPSGSEVEQFKLAYSEIRKKLGEDFEGQNILKEIDSFYSKKLDEKLAKMKKGLWGKIQSDLDTFRADVVKKVSDVDKLGKDKSFRTAASAEHPIFKYDQKAQVKLPDYNEKDANSVITVALKGHSLPSNNPFLIAEESSASSYRIVEEFRELMAAGAITDQKKQDNTIVGVNDKCLGNYVSKIFNEVWPKYFTPDPNNIYRVLSHVDGNYLVVSELNPKLEPDSIFGPGVAYKTTEAGKHYLAIPLPKNRKLSREVDNLSSYTLFMARSKFEEVLGPSREFLGRAASLVHSSVEVSMNELLDNFMCHFAKKL